MTPSHREVFTCRACGGRNLESVIDLGTQRLSEFRTDDSVPDAFPLELVRCPGCGLAQLRHTVDPARLFHETYSFKSGVSDGIRRDLRDVVSWTLSRLDADPAAWLDVASNDGTLLSFVPPDVVRYGIDPLEQFAAEARTHATDVVVDYFDPRYYGCDSMDVITTVSMFYDLNDPNAFVAGVAQVMTPGGVWVCQQNYLPAMIEATSVDNISHEHLCYYGLRTFDRLVRRHGLEVTDVALSAVNGGCVRTLVTRTGRRRVSDNVTRALADEATDGTYVSATYDRFRHRARVNLAKLRTLVKRLNREGRSVWVYGASTRGAVLWQAADLNSSELPYVVERNPGKVGRWMSALGSPIISEEKMRAEPPDYLLVGPWWFREAFIQREREFLDNGGRFIVPLPQVEVIGRDGVEA